MRLSFEALRASVDRQWNESILPALQSYIMIPCVSPAFDPSWQAHGYIEDAVELMKRWCKAQPLPGIRVQVLRGKGLTPLLLVDVPGDTPACVLIYGHLDKQPSLAGWLPGLGPWQPVERGGKLYGRGGADDGYAVFSAIAAIVALREQGMATPRCVVLIEASEESGSVHLAAHLDALGDQLPDPSLILCLDAECGDYDRLWCTTSLRGCVDGELHVRTLSGAVHSGFAGGIAPCPLHVAANVLARLGCGSDSMVTLPALSVEIPFDRAQQTAAAARVLAGRLIRKIPLLPGVQPVASEAETLLVNSTWCATLAVSGIDGIPRVADAGNVILPQVSLRISLRLPPTLSATRAAEAIRGTLESHPPHGADVCVEITDALSGWNAPPAAPWLQAAIELASSECFGAPAESVGCGGTIPFLPMLSQRFPEAQVLATGVLGPGSNAHGPNEFLHLDYVRRLNCCIASVLADCAAAHTA